MKILVTVKRVPDADQPLRVHSSGKQIDAGSLAFVVNPFDAIALEEALRLREGSSHPVEVLAVSVGSQACEAELRTALAMGADRAVLVDCSDPLDPWNVARLLEATVRRESPDLVMMGKQAIDDDANQTGQFLAALLDWPQATFASRVEWLGDPMRVARETDAGIETLRVQLRVARETDAGIETLRVQLPVVITADLRLNEPRYASLPSLIRARSRPIERVTAADLGVANEPRVEVLRLEPVLSSRACVRVGSVDELVDRLRHEARVI